MVLSFLIQEEILSSQRSWSRQTSSQMPTEKVEIIQFGTLHLSNEFF